MRQAGGGFAWERALLIVALAGIALGSLVAVSIPAGLGWDFANYYDAGHKALVGETVNLYDEQALIDGQPPQSNMLFLSAPISSFFYAPLALFDPPAALFLFKVENVVALLLALGVLFYSLRAHVREEDQLSFAALFFAAALLFQPFWTVFRVGGQVTPTIMLLLAVGALFHSGRRFALSALCFSLIVLIKPVFLPGAAFLAFASGRRFFIVSLLTGLSIAALSVALLGFDLHLAFVERMLLEGGRAWPSHYNSALTSALNHLVPDQCDAAGFCRVGGPAAIASTLIRAGAVIALIALYLRAWRGGMAESPRLHLAWMLAAILPVMATPIVWAHYLSVVFLLVAFIIAMRREFAKPALYLLAALVVFSVGQNLIFILKIVAITGMDGQGEQIAMGLFKSVPLWLTLALFVAYGRSIINAYRTPSWTTLGDDFGLTGAAARLSADPRIRFIFTGGSLAVLNWLLRFPLSAAMPYEAAVILSATAMTVVGFFLYREFVFQSSSPDIRRQIVLFMLVSAGAVAVTAVVSATASDFLEGVATLRRAEAEAFGHIIGIAAAAVWNFLGHRYVTFAKKAA
ncbi:MAG TPA: GtrA family protein [Parvularculaceae bacterium]|nr:GtrA family protein [Parvularculaceae bacterium]